MAGLDDVIGTAFDEAGIRRKRLRKNKIKINREKVGIRVVQMHNDDIADRQFYIDDRIQRYAKYRMWAERASVPWEDASDIPMPGMMTDSLRLQDTLHNAVMSFTPPVTSTAMRTEEKDKEDTVDNLISHQVFNDMNGESLVGDLTEAFVNDGFFVAYIPWIIEDAKISDLRIQEPIPENILPLQYFSTLMADEFPQRPFQKTDDEGWDWIVPDDDEGDIKVSFYTREKDDKVEMAIEKMERIFDGPKPIVVEIDDITFPWRSANLQPPGPSNPHGAGHVILSDTPTLDEIARLQKQGWYDLITKKDLEDLKVLARDETDDSKKDQKDQLQGTNKPINRTGHTSLNGSQDDPTNNSERTLTRLICFDRMDIDNDGIEEDVMIWVIKENRKVLKIKLMSEMFPANPPRRPLVSASMIPVPGRVIGISLLEMMEGLHDAGKEIMDQMIDSGTMANSPFFFYKSTNLNPENITLEPGEGMPMGDPKNDIVFPNTGNQGQAFGFNMHTILTQMNERLTMTSDLQRGQIPDGKSSALRTASGIQAVLAQGEARPERVLRRFFMGLTEIWAQIHELNQRMLPEDKKILISGNLEPAQDPYQTVSDKSAIKGRFQFRFDANILNTSKGAMQEALSNIMAVGITDIALQLGIIDKDGIYRLIRDFTKANGQDPNEYFKRPSPEQDQQRITAEEAIISIASGVMPGGVPIDGWIAHLERLSTFIGEEGFASFKSTSIALLQQYLQIVQQKAQQELQQQQQLQAAQRFQQQQLATTGGGGGGAAPDMSNPPVNANETINENLQEGS